MANRQVTLIWRCKTASGWKRFPCILGGNGRPRKGIVIEAGQERVYKEGRFQLRFYEGSKMIYQDVGPDSSQALEAVRVRENALKAQEHAARAGLQIAADSARPGLKKAYQDFLQAAADRGCHEARLVYKNAVDEFFQVITNRTYVDELRVEDMLKYQRALAGRGCADRTIFNRWTNVKAFFIYCGIDPKKMRREDGQIQRLMAPKYEQETPEIYEEEELKPFFAAIASNQRLSAACKIMHRCALREQEMEFLEWHNVNLNSSTIKIRGNPRYGFKVKDSEQRDVPVPQTLLEWLLAYRAAHPQDVLVAPTRRGRPNSKYLQQVKTAARRAGLNCGGCYQCIARKECCHWFLHKFRATCITQWLRAGLDLRTVMKLSGHSDLASVMRYLRPADDDAVRARVDRIAAGD